VPDDKDGREKQAKDADDRQRRRDVAAELECGDEPEPEIDAADLGDVEAQLESLTFPATGRRSSRRSETAISGRRTSGTPSSGWSRKPTKRRSTRRIASAFGYSDPRSPRP